MRFLIIAFVLVGAQLCLSPSHAQDWAFTPAATSSASESSPTPSGPEPTPSVAPTPTPPFGNDIAFLEYGLLESGYQLNPQKSTRNRLIAVAELVIGGHCISGFSPHYRSEYQNEDSACARLIERVAQLDDSNPAVACARSGIDSSECSRAHAATNLAQLAMHQSSQDPKDVEAYMEASERKDHIENYRELKNDLSSYKRTPTEEGKAKIDAGLTALIPKLCAVTRYHVLEAKEAAAAANEAISNLQPGDAFNSVLDQLSKPLARTTAAPEPFTRQRLVGTECYGILSTVKNLWPEHPSFLCVTETIYSPRCAKARKLAAERQRRGQNLPTRPADAIQPF